MPNTDPDLRSYFPCGISLPHSKSRATSDPSTTPTRTQNFKACHDHQGMDKVITLTPPLDACCIRPSQQGPSESASGTQP